MLAEVRRYMAAGEWTRALRMLDARGWDRALLLDLLVEMKETLAAAEEPNDQVMADVYHRLGRVQEAAGQVLVAHANYLRAHQCCERLAQTDRLAAEVHLDLGRLCVRRGDAADALEYLQVAQGYYEEEADAQRLADTLHQRGLAHLPLKELDAAQMCLQTAQDLYVQAGCDGQAQRVRQDLARQVQAAGRPEQAIEELLTCAREWQEAGDFVSEADAQAQAADVCLATDQVLSAKRCMEQAMRVFEQASSEPDERYAHGYRVYAACLLAMQQPEAVEDYAYRAAELYTKLGMDQEAERALHLCAEAHRAQNLRAEARELLAGAVQELSDEEELLFPTHPFGKGMIH